MLGNRAKKASTAVAGRVSGGGAVSGMRGMAAGMGLSMGPPMLAGGIEQAMGEGSKGGSVGELGRLRGRGTSRTSRTSGARKGHGQGQTREDQTRVDGGYRPLLYDVEEPDQHAQQA